MVINKNKKGLSEAEYLYEQDSSTTASSTIAPALSIHGHMRCSTTYVHVGVVAQKAGSVGMTVLLAGSLGMTD